MLRKIEVELYKYQKELKKNDKLNQKDIEELIEKRREELN